MNLTAPIHRTQTSCALGIALLISGITSASQRGELVEGPAQRHGYETYSKASTDCATGPRVIIFDHDLKRSTAPCTGHSTSYQATSEVRLARPLSSGSFTSANENIRYSF